jgi:Ca2+-binding RTX toxin-like protein
MNLRGLFRNRIRLKQRMQPLQSCWRRLAQRRETRRGWQTEQLECRLLLTATPNGGELRTYRLAVAATEEYTAFFGDSRTAAQQAIANSVATFNEILNRELNVHLELIPNLDIIFGGNNPTADPFSSSIGAVLGQNQMLLDTAIGEADYDIGHVFGTFAGGGLATVGAAGVDGIKGQGASGTSTPTGSGFDKLAIHELGHQFGATHTFNGSDLARTAASAWEPGSGSTIMSYAGLLPPSFAEPPVGNNLQNEADDYFHAGSLDQIVSHLATLDTAGVGTITSAVNQIPTVNAGADFTIPAGTSFTLSAAGTDADGDTLLYNFEQMDLGAAQTVDSNASAASRADNGSSPLFRSFEPAAADASGSFTRVFPQLSDILSGTPTKGEQLPTTARDLNFRATVRDQQGGTDGDDLLLTVVDTGSAFSITMLNSTATLTGGATQEITWDVAGTTANGINVSDVEILLSTDGGLTFPHSLATTANDGSHTVDLPNIDTSTVRFQVQAVGNVFFDITNANVTITTNAAAPGASVTESGGGTSVGEVSAVGAATDTYTIALNTAPTSAVDITVTGDDDVLVSTDGSTFNTSITLSVADTSVQTIHLRAFNDADVEGTHTGAITQTVSASSDANYPVDLLINGVTATVIDDERPPLVAVDLQASGNTVPVNWTEINENDPVFSLTKTPFSDLIREDGSASMFDLTIGPTVQAGGTSAGSNPDSDTVPIHSPLLDDVGSLLLWTNAMIANWAGLTAGEKYNVYVMTVERFSGTDINQTVTILGDGSDDPAPFTQTTTGFGGELLINTQQGDSSQLLEDFALTVTADSSGEIDIQLVRDDGEDSNFIILAAVAIQHALTPTSEPPLIPVVTFDAGIGRLTVNARSDHSIAISALNGSSGTVVVTVNASADSGFGSVAPGDVQSIVVNGGPGANTIDLTAVSKSAFTNVGGVAITVLGAAGNDTLFGSNFADNIDGEAGDDLISGGAGTDMLLGGADNDVIYGGSGGDFIEGGAGHDNIFGRFGGDVISGDGGADTISGGAGRDSIRGGSGNDVIRGDRGPDSLFGEAGNDTISGGTGRDSISGGDDADSLIGNGGADGINAGAGDDIAFGLGGADTILGLTGNDTLNGGSRGDTLIGGDDDDDLTGAGGTDKLAGGGELNDVFDDDGEKDEAFTESMFAALLALA